jgi:hypothetical protein
VNYWQAFCWTTTQGENGALWAIPFAVFFSVFIPLLDADRYVALAPFTVLAVIAALAVSTWSQQRRMSRTNWR